MRVRPPRARQRARLRHLPSRMCRLLATCCYSSTFSLSPINIPIKSTPQLALPWDNAVVFSVFAIISFYNINASSFFFFLFYRTIIYSCFLFSYSTQLFRSKILDARTHERESTQRQICGFYSLPFRFSASRWQFFLSLSLAVSPTASSNDKLLRAFTVIRSPLQRLRNLIM